MAFMVAVLIFLAYTTIGGVAASSMTNSWAVEIEFGGTAAADALASKYGFINLGQVGNLKTMYHFVKPDLQNSKRSKRNINEFPVSYHITEQLEAEDNVGYVKQQVRRKMYKKEGYIPPSDPNWSDQWSLLNTGQLNPSDAGRDLNVERVWLQGVTGCGTIVSVVDDGVEYTHLDLKNNYVRSLQYDFLNRDNNAFPASSSDGVRESHGTSVAGEIAMEKGNEVCGVGVAYNSQITGLRLITDPGATDIDEADAFSWKTDMIDIYSNSWGPQDDGIVVEGPGDLLKMTLKTTIAEGRGGKGPIFTFAAGNGGAQDTCAADGYTNSIYTISVGSASSNGSQSSFDEMCSGKMVVTFDTDPYQDTRHVATTDVQDACTTGFDGTSASTPLVSGVIALLLEANPDLSWRDVQYLIAYTSNTGRLADGEWVANGGGLLVSHKFGFGAIDAEAIVSRGRHWISVPPQLEQTVTPPTSTGTVNATDSLSFNFEVSSNIVFLEHVVLVFNLYFVGVTPELYDTYFEAFNNDEYIYWPERGLIEITLTSPSGTTSTLLPLRYNDALPGNYTSWPFMSLHFWGENPTGTWVASVSNADVIGSVRVEISSVTFYGTSQTPEAVSRIPTQCSPECDPMRGCAASGAEFCDACRVLRMSSTLECISSCPDDTVERNGYCYNASMPEMVCANRVSSARGVVMMQWSAILILAVSMIYF